MGIIGLVWLCFLLNCRGTFVSGLRLKTSEGRLLRLFSCRLLSLWLLCLRLPGRNVGLRRVLAMVVEIYLWVITAWVTVFETLIACQSRGAEHLPRLQPVQQSKFSFLLLVDMVIFWEWVVQISIFCPFRRFTDLQFTARLERLVDWAAIFLGSVTLIFDYFFLWRRVTIDHWSHLELGAFA